jgi:hypothetical protein
MQDCSDEATQGVLNCSARIDGTSGDLVGRESERERLAQWLDRPLALRAADGLVADSPLCVISGVSGIGKTSLVAHETQAWRARHSSFVWWLRAPLGVRADRERDLFYATHHSAGFCCANGSPIDIGDLSPAQILSRVSALGVVQGGTLVLDGVSALSDVLHFRRLGFGRVIVTTPSEMLADYLAADLHIRLQGVSDDEALTLLRNFGGRDPSCGSSRLTCAESFMRRWEFLSC